MTESIPDSKSTHRIIVNSFIAFHMIAFVCWASPFNWEPRDQVVHWIAPYMLWSGLWQGWDMFAPDPLSINAHIEATITFLDGTQTKWIFPRMEKLSYFDRYLKERYRKWWSSYVRIDTYSSTWPDTARFVARKFNNPSNPPKQVEFTRYWMEIPPPQSSSTLLPSSEEFSHPHSYHFYTFSLSEKDLS